LQGIFRLCAAGTQAFQPFINSGGNEEYQHSLGVERAQFFSALHIHTQHHIHAADHGFVYLGARDTFIILIHMCPLDELIAFNHGFKFVFRIEEVIFAMHFAGAGRAAGGSHYKVERHLALLHLRYHAVFTSAGWTRDDDKHRLGMVDIKRKVGFHNLADLSGWK